MSVTFPKLAKRVRKSAEEMFGGSPPTNNLTTIEAAKYALHRKS